MLLADNDQIVAPILNEEPPSFSSLDSANGGGTVFDWFRNLVFHGDSGTFPVRAGFVAWVKKKGERR